MTDRRGSTGNRRRFSSEPVLHAWQADVLPGLASSPGSQHNIIISFISKAKSLDPCHLYSPESTSALKRENNHIGKEEADNISIICSDGSTGDKKDTDSGINILEQNHSPNGTSTRSERADTLEINNTSDQSPALSEAIIESGLKTSNHDPISSREQLDRIGSGKSSLNSNCESLVLYKRESSNRLSLECPNVSEKYSSFHNSPSDEVYAFDDAVCRSIEDLSIEEIQAAMANLGLLPPPRVKRVTFVPKNPIGLLEKCPDGDSSDKCWKKETKTEQLLKKPLPSAQLRSSCRRQVGEIRSGRRALLRFPRCQIKYEKIFSKQKALLRKSSVNSDGHRSQLAIDSVNAYSGCAAWRQRQKLQWNKIRIKFKEIGIRLELWRGSFKTIEGHYGSGVASYFVFLRWLFLLNLLIFFLVFLFIIIPQVVFTAQTDSADSITGGTNDSRLNTSYICSNYYTTEVTSNVSQSAQDIVLDFLQGTGWMEYTVLFHGYYVNRELTIGTFSGISYSYNMPLAYLLVTIITLALSLILMVKHTASGFKNRQLEQEDKYHQYCNVVFGGWDYTLNDPKTCELKHKSLWNEISANLEEERRREQRRGRTGCQKFGLYTRRFLINLFVLAVLGGSSYLIYYATTESLKFTDRADYDTINNMVKLLMEYVPSITIAFLNFVVPVLFEKVVTGEDYSPEWEIHVTLGRTVFLRLASLGVLLGTIYTQITCGSRDSCNVGDASQGCFALKCWETYVGQQIYKLVIMDFITVMAVVFLVDFPRRIVVTKCSCKLAKLVGKAEFYIPKNVLDLVYSQALCWLGAYFSPLIPGICVVKSFLVFYLKKVTCIYNYVPPARPYRASRSHSFFMVVLLSAFILCCVPVGYVIWKITPSYGCGPFRIYSQTLEIMTITISTWPPVFQQIITFITSAGFILPLFVILLLVIYYYSSISNANKEMVSMLKEQLVLEGKDKQFLLARLNEITGKGPPGMDKGKSIKAAHATSRRRPTPTPMSPPPGQLYNSERTESPPRYHSPSNRGSPSAPIANFGDI